MIAGRIDRYVGAALLKGWGLVLAVLMAIFGLLAFVEELESVTARYQAADALRFVAWTLPQRAYDLSPVVALLGTLIALAGLARTSELTALRAAGMSVGHLLRAVMLPTLALMAGLWLFAEYVAAPVYQKAETERTVLRSGRGHLIGGLGLWSNSGRRFFNVRELRLGHIPTGIFLYEFEPGGRLKTAIHAHHARVREGRRWTLVDVQYKTYEQGRLRSRHLDSLDMGPFWSREELPALSLSTAGMSLSGLYEYARYLEQTGQRADRIRLAFWRKLTVPLAVAAMVLLATPLGGRLDSGRGTRFGQRIALGALIGILFYLGSQIAHTSGLLLRMDAAGVALLPVLLTSLVAALLLRRMR